MYIENNNYSKHMARIGIGGHASTRSEEVREIHSLSRLTPFGIVLFYFTYHNIDIDIYRLLRILKFDLQY